MKNDIPEIKLLPIEEYNILGLGLHLDMVKVIKMLYGRESAEYYFRKHLPKLEDSSYTVSSESVTHK